MKFFVWLIRVLVFVVLLVLALANTQPAGLNIPGGLTWNAPLIVIGLAFFVVGIVAGLLTGVPRRLRQRREMARLQRELRFAREAPANRDDLPPMPPIM